MRERAVPSRPGDGPGDDGLSSLRAILVGPEQRRLAALQARIEDSERRAEEIGDVLPDVLVRQAQDPAFTRALTPAIESAITSSVQKNPRPLADALFPIMGPAIRKAVQAALAGMVESLDRTLALSLSGRSLRWRIEAWRTGRSFGEVVLAHTLLYRVEQVLLIDGRTGLLLQHVTADVQGVRDADMVSGMLTAIRDFAKDSFEVSDQEGLESLEVGDLNVWMEAGPHAVVAAVIRGTAAPAYREVLEVAVESVHLRFGGALAAFDGDASLLDGTRPILESCLQAQFKEEDKRVRGARWVFAAAGAALLVWLALTVRDSLRWGRYLDALRAEPGLTVVSTDRRGGRFVVTGLRDPLAADPLPLLASVGLPPDRVTADWTPYQALDPEIALVRAQELLSPPAGVTLALADGVLSSSGPAPAEWIREARRMAPFVAGVRRFDAAGAAGAAVQGAIQALERGTVLFLKGSSRTAPGQDGAVAALVASAGELSALAEAGGLHFRLEIVGHTDEDGLPGANLPLSRSRAEVLRAAMTPALNERVEVTTAGVGSTQPAAQGRSEDEKQRNRRAQIRVTALGAG